MCQRFDNCHVVFCELFLKALFTCVFQVELIKVSTLRGPCLPTTDGLLQGDT